ncbi:MAG: Acireductone dioxygenase [Candidatus Marinimicrobia bacterium]|nr:Acireductone dioxygenase [Candidatus Neomarinimicrobiota bacterium]
MAQNISIQKWEKNEQPDPEELKQTLREEGYGGIHMFSDHPGATYGDHQHNYVEVRWLVDGEVTFGVGDEKYTLQPGDRLDMPANTVHNARMHPEKGATYVCASK